MNPASPSLPHASAPPSLPPNDTPLTRVEQANGSAQREGGPQACIPHPSVPRAGVPRAVRPQKPSGGFGYRRAWILAGVLAGLLLAGLGAQRWLFASAAGNVEITAAVTRADLPVIVTERGQLESAK